MDWAESRIVEWEPIKPRLTQMIKMNKTKIKNKEIEADIKGEDKI